ncbi:MAG: hypothetical protein ABI980_15270, partial [Nitrospirota bacterium]
MKSAKKMALLMIMTVFAFVTAPISTRADQDTLPMYLEQEQGPTTKYHLTAGPWLPMGSENYLEVVEGIARWLGQQEDPHIPGRILEPFGIPSSPSSPQIERGALPLSVAILHNAGRARDLLDLAIRVMDYETKWYADKIMLNDDPGTLLFSNRQVLAFEALSSISAIPTSTLDSWRQNLFVPSDMLSHIMTISGSANSYCYRMLAEWNRYRLGLAYDHSTLMNAIENQWSGDSLVQHDLLVPTRWNLYRDLLTNPDSLSTEAAGRASLLLLAHSGYDGPSVQKIRSAAERGTHTMLFLQSPTGESPPNGRADNHLWVDAENAMAMELLAEQTAQRGNSWLAGQFRRAAMLTLSPQNLGRFQRGDGSYFATKNRFDPSLHVSYQGEEGLGSNADLMAHLAKIYQIRKTNIPEHPAPSEIGGYAINLDPTQAAAFANAGGLMLQINTRGEVSNPFTKLQAYDNTTPLGVVRFGRAGWDTRLGPGDGQQNWTRDEGISFAPTFFEDGGWTRLASVPKRYQGTFSVEFAHPLLVRCAVVYSGSGPSFRNEFILTPDGIVSLTTSSGGAWGMTVPLLTDDGAETLKASFGNRIARTSFASGSDEENFIALNPSASLEDGGAPMRSPYGYLRPIRVTTSDEENRIFVYPRNAADPSAETVRDSFVYNSSSDFSSVLGRVSGNLYMGRTSAGGVGDSIDLDGDGTPDVTFSATCGFILQLRDGSVA